VGGGITNCLLTVSLSSLIMSDIPVRLDADPVLFALESEPCCTSPVKVLSEFDFIADTVFESLVNRSDILSHF
jgi:hypothetical protein